MKKLRKIYSLCLVFIFIMVFGQVTEAKINFKAGTQNRIDFEKLAIDKEDFFSFFNQTIKTKPAGLQKYGRVPLKPCDLKIKNRRLIDYKTPKGKEYKYLTNPSCAQILIRKILEKSYNYQINNLSAYQSRKCIMNIENIFSPLLEYYTIRYEEKPNANCQHCDNKEQRRLQKIISAQQKIMKACNSEQEKVLQFIQDLDEVVEKAFQAKTK